ncbi:MAG: isoprenylcysteine carboxylmethyltransferase family protein [Planctomycetes bacterium]|nr:isoprenylcysteine carboxylmethyltransferase family protein [Planctomycetota bacterium]
MPNAGPILDRIPLPIRKVAYYLSFLGVLLVVVPLGLRQIDAWLGWPALPLPVGGRIVGWTVFAICFLLYTAASIHLMSRGRGGYVEFDPPKEFVATGAFRWCRNPIAACVLGMIFGEAIGLASISMLSLFAVGLPIAHAQVVLLEEPLLRQRFGAAYDEYTRRVPRWIPRRPRESVA